VTEVYAIVEGQTEETFVKQLLSEQLAPRGVYLTPLLTGTRKSRRAHKGGHRGSYPAIRADILRTLKQHAPRGCLVTTMLDLYALPTDFPGFQDSTQASDPYRRVAGIEEAMAGDISDRRFIPYIQLHEFEALLLACPAEIERYYPTCQEGVANLTADVAAFPGPEWVDDGKTTAPSKRIKTAAPGYDKVLAGSLIAMQIGLPRIIEACPHFAEWVGKLQALGGEDA